LPRPPRNDHQLYNVSKILGARYNEQFLFHELSVAWRRFPVGEATWERFSVLAVAVSELMTKFIESHDDPDMVARCDIFESSHGDVLCVS
jgi:hypothetical protein